MTTPDPKLHNRFTDLLTRLPIAWFCLGFISGILVANWIHLPWWLWLTSALLGLIILLFTRFVLPRFAPKAVLSAFLIILALFGGSLGALNFELHVLDAESKTIGRYNDLQKELVITGWVASPPDVRDQYTNLRLAVSAVDSGNGDTPVTGTLLALVENDDELQYGDVIRLRGRLVTPFETEDFSYGDYLARQGIQAYMPWAGVTRLPFPPEGKPINRWIYSINRSTLERIHAIFPDPEAALLGGILLGNDNGLTKETQQAFRDTGTAHVIAISGFNITIIIGFFILIFRRIFGKRIGYGLAILGVFFYVILVGANPSVVRAAIMGSLGIAASLLGRRRVGINILCFSAAVMTYLDPGLLWDVGFQLSFAATLGIILYIQTFTDWVEKLLTRLSIPAVGKRTLLPITAYIFISIAAQVMVLPLIAWHFKTISITSLLANFIILPVQPLVMILGGIALLVSFIYLPLGQILAWVAWPFPAFTIRAVEWVANLPIGVIHLGEFSLLFVVAWYIILFAFTFSQGKTKEFLRTSLTPATILVPLLILVVLIWSASYTAPDGALHITFLPAGSAEAILIRTPAGRNILINGGESASSLSTSLGRRTSPFSRQLDWLIVASARYDQLGAFPRTLELFPPGNVLWSGNTASSWEAEQLNIWLTGRSIPVTQAASGMEMDLGSGAILTVQDVTSRGAILLIEWNGFRCLLPIGQNYESLETSGDGKAIGPVSVLLLSDAGKGQTNPLTWIEELHPQVVILSIAAGEDSNIPDPAVLRSIEGATLLRTDRNGWIEVSTNGKTMWVDVEKK